MRASRRGSTGWPSRSAASPARCWTRPGPPRSPFLVLQYQNYYNRNCTFTPVPVANAYDKEDEEIVVNQTSSYNTDELFTEHFTVTGGMSDYVSSAEVANVLGMDVGRQVTT